jgi:hypothetical protein
VSPGWGYLAWRSLPLVLVLAWFLILIGGFNLAGVQHLILLGAVGVFGYQVWADAPPDLGRGVGTRRPRCRAGG